MSDNPEEVLNLIKSYAMVNSVENYQWILDQIVQILAEDYNEFIAEYSDGDDGPFTFTWEKGKPPDGNSISSNYNDH